jgi:pilus assembly protein Flp/PilA
VKSARQSIEALGSDVFAVLARGFPIRLVEISRSGCLLETQRPVEPGVVGELRLESGGTLVVDDVRVTRCVRVEGSGSSYLVGAEFVQTRRAGEGSIRRAMSGILRSVAPVSGLPAKKGSRNGRKAAALAAPSIVNVSSTGEGETVMKDLFARLVREDEGQDLIEYGLLAGLITTVLVAAINLVGAQVLDYFNDLNDALPDVD